MIGVPVSPQRYLQAIDLRAFDRLALALLMYWISSAMTKSGLKALIWP